MWIKRRITSQASQKTPRVVHRERGDHSAPSYASFARESWRTASPQPCRFPCLMLCAPPVQAPVPQLILVGVSKHPGQKPPQAVFRELLGKSPQHMRACGHLWDVPPGCPWPEYGHGGSSSQWGKSDRRDPAQGNTELGRGVVEQKRSQDSGTPSTRKGPPSRVEAGSQEPQESSSLKLRTPAEVASQEIGPHSLMRGERGPQHQEGSRALKQSSRSFFHLPASSLAPLAHSSSPKQSS